MRQRMALRLVEKSQATANSKTSPSTPVNRPIAALCIKRICSESVYESKTLAASCGLYKLRPVNLYRKRIEIIPHRIRRKADSLRGRREHTAGKTKGDASPDNSLRAQFLDDGYAGADADATGSGIDHGEQGGSGADW